MVIRIKCFLARFVLPGAVAGSRYRLHERFSVFGEFGVGVALDEAVDLISNRNTGVGVVYYF